MPLINRALPQSRTKPVRPMVAALCAAAMLASAAPGSAGRATEPAANPQGQFGRTILRGVRIDAPPRVLWNDPGILSSERICAGVDQLRPAIAEGVNFLVNEFNNELRARAPGLLLVRHRATVSPRCSARATYVPGALILDLDLPQNDFTSNVTIPAGILWRQSFDPRLSMKFDVAVSIWIPLPSAGGQCLGAPQATATVRNIRLPEGRNITGDIVAAGIDVGSSIYDRFNNGRLGQLLGRGVSWQRAVPAGFVAEANRHLCGSGVPYRSLTIGTAPGDLLVMALSTGARVTDNRCIDGYVWRGARPGDDVCVRPEARARVRAENAAHASRAQPFDPRMASLRVCAQLGTCPPEPVRCLAGFVWREAVPGDRICVPPSSRALAAQENTMARRLRRDYEPPIN